MNGVGGRGRQDEGSSVEALRNSGMTRLPEGSSCGVSLPALCSELPFSVLLSPALVALGQLVLC